MKSGVRTNLSIMMLLQYAIWGAWAVSIGQYMNEILKFSGREIGLIYGTTAIAAMISPMIVGFLADRFFAVERLIGALHLIGAVLMFYAASQESFTALYPIMLIYAICYMPTLALTNSISFSNIDDPEKDFPPIRVWGTWGWIFVGWLVSFVLDEKSNTPLYASATLSAILGVFSFVALPHTPPKGKSGSDEKGESVLGLLKDTSFLVFIICSFLICVPLSFYYSWANAFLGEIDAPYPTALQTIGQLSEVGFMALMPFFIVRLGIKKMLILGMFAWVLRYLCFGSLQLPLVVFGLVLHGICYDFFFVASQIYVDKRASDAQRASAQSFIAFITMGVGMFVGAWVAGEAVGMYPPEVTVKVTVTPEPADGNAPESLPLPAWDIKEASERGGLAKEMALEPDSLLEPEKIPADFTIEADGTKTVFDQESFIAAVKSIDTDGDGKVSRAEWRVGQRKQWTPIWFWPAGAALVTLVIFLIGFHENKASSVEEEKTADSEEPAEE